jgi:hypothetical protein
MPSRHGWHDGYERWISRANDAVASEIETGLADMNRNTLYLVIGVLAAIAVVVGYLLYQERQKTHGVDINVGKSGISIETN